MSLQDPSAKMGKTGSSEQGTVRMLDEPDVILKKFKTAVTDSGREVRKADDKPGVSNLIDIMSVATGSTPAQIEAEYADAGYGTFKVAVGEAVVALLEPIRERYTELRADEGELLRLLALGADKARATSTPTLERMYETMGFVRLRKGDARARRGLRRLYSPTSLRSASTSSRVSGARLADRHLADVQARVAGAPESHDGEPDRLAHPSYLAVAALVQHELDARAAELPCPRRSSDAVLELDARRERGDGGLASDRPRHRRRRSSRRRSAGVRAGGQDRRRS